MRENEASIRGKVMRDLIAHVTNDHLIEKKIKNGELRKKIGDSEPPWKCPDCFSLEVIGMDNFSMEYLQSKENPNTEDPVETVPITGGTSADINSSTGDESNSEIAERERGK